jgi:hypothetical protein
MRTTTIAVILALSVGAAYAQMLKVKIIQRQDNTTAYSYAEPAEIKTSGYASCYETGRRSVDCSSTSQGTISGGDVRTFQVRGATYTLLLPDGRRVIVNCDGKYALHFDGVNTRSCHKPFADDIEAEFKGDDAKLRWRTSLDGKKTDSETYKIVGVFDAPTR